jgi:endonuclease/exonuclease/phosphatase family metal-dependent hydrolase
MAARWRLVPVVMAVAGSLFGGCEADSGGGEVLVLTYNVAGLQEELSGSDPVENIPRISPKLNDFDLVLVQEDFWYHADLAADDAHPYRSEPMWDQPAWDRMGDGLNRFSVFPFGPLTRVNWEVCNGYFDSGADCMTSKGFSVARHELAPGIEVDVYNLHMDAGGGDEDIAARVAEAEQLAAFIDEHSDGVAVLVAGDTNLKATRPEDMETLATFLAATGLTDSCRALDCKDERIDRVLFRSSNAVRLEPVTWGIPPGFTDDAGEQLSDHQPVAVTLAWRP